MTGRPRDAGLLSTITKFRAPLVLVPWRMRGSLVLLTAAAMVSAILDMLGVVAMLPLMQLLTSPNVLPTSVSRYVVPLVGTEDRQKLLLSTALFVGFMFIFKNIVMVALRWWSLGVLSRASAAAQSEMLRRYVHASYQSHRERAKPDIMQTVTSSVDKAFSVIYLGIISIATDLITAVALLGTLLWLAPAASLIAVFVFGGAALLMVRVIKPYALKFGIQNLELNTAMWASLNPAIEGFRESRIFRREDLFVNRFAKNRLASVQPNRAQQVLGELPRYLMEIVMILGVLIVAMVLFSLNTESTAFGLLAVFAAASTRIAPALNRVVANVNGVRSNVPTLEKVAEQMSDLAATTPTLRDETRNPVPVPDADIIVDHLSFRYPDSASNVLSDVTVTIPQGQTIALVGSSGAGKTTFADLLLGLFTPTSGTITVGGVDISTHVRDWRPRVASVSQKVYLWNASVRDLITFGQPAEEVDEALLDRAIGQAQLHGLIESMPGGLDTFVGEGGVRISGGQAQRIGIARALYAQPNVLILDEATSALDNETEHEITSTIDALHGTMTVVVVAHRLSTVRSADEILFFSGGLLVDRGTMSSLREANAEFAHLVELGQLV